MPQYQGIPAIPPEKIEQWQYDVMSAMKENLEILMGQRGPGRVVTNDSIPIEAAERQVMKQVSARGNYYNLATSAGTLQIPTRDDYVKLLTDVQQLSIDVANIQAALNALLINMRN
jgi:hypothetical protein